MFKTKFDIESDNFNLYFAQQAKTISPKAKESLPKDIAQKLFWKGGEMNLNNTSNLSFVAKIFVLWKAMKKRWWVVVEDKENGMNTEQFCELREAIKRKEKDFDMSGEMIASGTFITADEELCNTFHYLNSVSASKGYKYSQKIKNMPASKTSKNVTALKFMCDVFINYETTKKRVLQQRGISPPEWYVLIGLYHGDFMQSSILHRETFKYTYQSSQTRMKLAFGSLQAKGLIIKSGIKNGCKMKITALGTDMVNDILTKYILNF